MNNKLRVLLASTIVFFSFEQFCISSNPFSTVDEEENAFLLTQPSREVVRPQSEEALRVIEQRYLGPVTHKKLVFIGTSVSGAVVGPLTAQGETGPILQGMERIFEATLNMQLPPPETGFSIAMIVWWSIGDVIPMGNFVADEGLSIVRDVSRCGEDVKIYSRSGLIRTQAAVAAISELILQVGLFVDWSNISELTCGGPCVFVTVCWCGFSALKSWYMYRKGQENLRRFYYNIPWRFSLAHEPRNRLIYSLKVLQDIIPGMNEVDFNELYSKFPLDLDFRAFNRGELEEVNKIKALLYAFNEFKNNKRCCPRARKTSEITALLTNILAMPADCLAFNALLDLFTQTSGWSAWKLIPAALLALNRAPVYGGSVAENQEDLMKGFRGDAELTITKKIFQIINQLNALKGPAIGAGFLLANLTLPTWANSLLAVPYVFRLWHWDGTFAVRNTTSFLRKICTLRGDKSCGLHYDPIKWRKDLLVGRIDWIIRHILMLKTEQVNIIAFDAMAANVEDANDFQGIVTDPLLQDVDD